MANQHEQTCPVAAAVNVFGDKWSLIVLREAFYGSTRFKEFQENGGMARNILTDRLNHLVKEEILRKVDIGITGKRYAYKLTEKGKALYPIVAACNVWANKYVYGRGNETIKIANRKSGSELKEVKIFTKDGKTMTYRDSMVKVGKGADEVSKARWAKTA